MTPTPHIHVACYVRHASLVAPLDSTIRTLTRFETEGVIDDVTVSAWPAEVQLGDAPPHSDVVTLFEEFDAWADQWGVSIRPPFAVETRRSEFTGTTREMVRTPVQCLAIYVNGVLVEVFPHTADRTDDGATYTVRDALALLETHDIQAFGAGQAPATPPSQRPAAPEPAGDADSCPACESQLVTGQGVYTCPDCAWVGIATGPGQYRPATPHPVHKQAASSPSTEASPAPTGRH